MANFNAGTIEATLTLDRSDFTKDLKAAQAQAKAFEKNRINVELDVDGEAELAELRAKLKAIPDEKVTVEVDVDKDSTKNILGSTRALNGMRFAIAGVAGALPAFVPAIAGAAAVIVSLAGAAGIAGAGLAAFALVAAPAMDRVKKALKEADGDIKKLPKSLQALATAQANFQKTQKKLGENAGVYATLAAGYNLLSTVLRQLSPVITAVSSVLTVLITKLDTWAKSPAFGKVVDFISAEFGPVMISFAAILGNLAKTFGYLTAAFQPFTKILLGGLVAITAGWANWAAGLSKSDKFQSFIDYVVKNGPKVAALFVSIGAALINVGKALAPLGGPVLDTLTGFFTLIAKIPPDVLGPILVGVAAAIVLFQAWTAAVALFNLIMAANPIALVIIAIAALAAALIYAWKTNEGFRNTVIAVWSAIKNVILATVNWITGTMVPAIVGAFNWVINAAKAVWAAMVTVWNAIQAVIRTVAAAIVATVMTYFNIIRSYITTVLGGIMGVWRGFWNVFGGVIKAGINLVVAIWKLGWAIVSTTAAAVWKGITAIIKSQVAMIKALITAGLNIVKSIISNVWSTIRSLTSTVWNAIRAAIAGPLAAARSVVSTTANGIRTIISAAWNAVRSLTSSVWGALVTIVSGRMSAVKSTVSSAISAIKGFFSGAGSWLYNAGRDIIGGLLRGIESMISAVTGKLNALTQKIKDAKGPEDVDKKLLTPAGRWIIGGLMKGIDQMTRPLLKQLSGITDTIPNTLNVNGVGRLAPGLGGAGAAAVAAVPSGLTKDAFMEAMVQLIKEIRANTQPLIGNYNDASKDPREIAEEWWFASKGRGI